MCQETIPLISVKCVYMCVHEFMNVQVHEGIII